VLAFIVPDEGRGRESPGVEKILAAAAEGERLMG
jgi:hypothetical protein